MAEPGITLRVGIDRFHGTRIGADGTGVPYLATRILPDHYGSELLRVDRVAERLLPGEFNQISPRELRNIGWRCLFPGDYSDQMEVGDLWMHSVIARAAGAVVATGLPYPGSNGEKLLPVREVTAIVEEDGRPVATFERNGVPTPQPNSQLYVPINTEVFSARDVSPGQFKR